MEKLFFKLRSRTTDPFARIKNYLKFRVERLLLLGVHFHLLVIASVIGLVAIGGGLLVQETDAPFDDHETAIWWAFLRLTDPGYLGDDEGLARRVISTVVTVLGYVLFMGSLIAIMTQWLNQTIRNFERGLTPIVRRNHILILGWTNRTSEIVSELIRAEERVRRFLQLLGARGLHVVILSEDVSLERTMELRRALGSLWNPKKITFRSGIPLRIEHLERVDFKNASAIILPGADFAYGSADESDMRIIKTLMSISNQGKRGGGTGDLPLLVTEIFDSDKVFMAQRAYRGILEILASDVFITRCMAQNVRHPGLSHVFHEILSHGLGNEVYIHTSKQFTGSRFGDLSGAYPKAILLGIVRPQGESFCPLLNPPEDLILESEDRLVFLAENYRDCEPLRNYQLERVSRKFQEVSYAREKSKRRILILGWNHKAVDLLKEFGRQIDEQFEVAVLALVPTAQREAEIKQKDIDLRRVVVTHREGETTSLSNLREMEPDRYDNVVILGSDWVNTQEESDARTIVVHLVLRNVLDEGTHKPEILVDLLDSDNVAMFEDYDSEVLITPLIASHVLAQVALRREINVVYEELFAAGGAEICFRRVSDYGIAGQNVNFGELQEMSACRDEIALGIRQNGGVVLNPTPDEPYILSELDDLIVLIREN
ncbi:MAG: ion channel DMI1 [Gemmatimonadota bacterium]|nr:ion channel DMI1 [Gemmatimonadota bacterium]MYD60006.1 ion channel DMI1 [Gemmatimonadota bacterium]